MDAPEDRDVKLQKVSGDLLTQFRQRLPELLQVEDGEGGRRRRNTTDSLIALVREGAKGKETERERYLC